MPRISCAFFWSAMIGLGDVQLALELGVALGQLGVATVLASSFGLRPGLRASSPAAARATRAGMRHDERSEL